MSEKMEELGPKIQKSSMTDKIKESGQIIQLSSIFNNEENSTLQSQQGRDIESQQKNEPVNDTKSSSTASMKNFYVIASGYLLFTLTDSGLRMIILFQLYNLHYNVSNYF
jgi:hypothetical protein